MTEKSVEQQVAYKEAWQAGHMAAQAQLDAAAERERVLVEAIRELYIQVDDGLACYECGLCHTVWWPFVIKASSLVAVYIHVEEHHEPDCIVLTLPPTLREVGALEETSTCPHNCRRCIERWTQVGNICGQCLCRMTKNGPVPVQGTNARS